MKDASVTSPRKKVPVYKMGSNKNLRLSKKKL